MPDDNAPGPRAEPDDLHRTFGRHPSCLARQTGEPVYVELFAAVLEASKLLYVVAIPNHKVPDFIAADVSMLEFLGGVPKAIVPNNSKSAVIKAGRDAVIQHNCADTTAY